MTRWSVPAALLALAACTSRPAPASFASPPPATSGGLGLAPIDARTAGSARALRFVDPSLAGDRLRPGAALQVDERMGLPTFVWTRPDPDPVRRAAVRRLGPEAAARGHLAELAPLYALTAVSAARAEFGALHDTGRGGIIARFTQRVQGVPVFGTSLSVLMDRELQPLAVTGSLSPDAEAAEGVALDFRLDEADAIDRALTDLHGTSLPRQALGASRTDQSGATLHEVLAPPAGVVFSRPPRTRPVLFQLPERLEPATYVELVASTSDRSDSVAYAYVFSAVDGRLLLRRDLSSHAAFTYRAWAGAGAPYLPPPGPQGRGATPYPTAAPSGLVLPFTAPALVSLQNSPFSRNDPWLPDGAGDTTGNNVAAYADLGPPDGFNTDTDLSAGVTSTEIFDRSYDTALAPAASPDQVKAAVTQLFFVTNFLHDWYYDSGFDEAAGNAQENNLGRGGAGGDRLHAEAQDFSGTDNANMMTPADGASPRMQMYVWTAKPKGVVEIMSPPALAGTLTSTLGANFGPSSFTVPETPLALVDDGVSAPGSLGCAALVNGAALVGRIAVVDRGGCTFVIKVGNAQAAGAVAVLVVNNVAGQVRMAGADPAITIPALSISQAEGEAIKARLGAGVTARLSGSKGQDRDGSIDNTVVAHEWGHYVSNRLIGNGSGLANNQGRSMGEGWSDFFALLMMVQAGDTAVAGNGTWGGSYALAGYATFELTPDPYYYGIRRVPYSTDPDRNGLTFKHIADGVALPVGPPTAFGADGVANSEVHNAGEVWGSMLWECYAALLRDTGRLSFDQAQRRMKDYLIASLKLTPQNPTFLEARDAVLAAALAGDPADHRLFAQAFARRGAGTRAVAPSRDSTDHAGVVESFSASDDVALVSATLDDSTGATCGTTGVLAAGGSGLLTVTLRNVGLDPLAATSATVGSVAAGLGFPSGRSLSFAPMDPGATATATLPVTLDASVTGIQVITLSLMVTDPAMPTPLAVDLVRRLNFDTAAGQSAGDDVEGQATAWSPTAGPASAPGSGWRRVERSPVDHRWQAPVSTDTGEWWLVSPALEIGYGPASITFSHRFDYWYGYDTAGAALYASGGVVEASQAGGAWTDLGSSITPGYTQTLAAWGGPLDGRRAFAGRSVGWPDRATATINLATRYAGKSIRVRFRSAQYGIAITPGWEVDDIVVSGVTNLPFGALVGRGAACLQAPSAVATAPATGTVGVPVALDGTGSSDPSSRALSYAWAQVSGPEVSLDGASTASPSFSVASLAGPQPIAFSLRVSNGLLWSASAYVTVTVSPAPPPPRHGGGCSSTGQGLDGAFAPLLGLALGLWLRGVGRARRRAAA